MIFHKHDGKRLKTRRQQRQQRQEKQEDLRQSVGPRVQQHRRCQQDERCCVLYISQNLASVFVHEGGPHRFQAQLEGSVGVAGPTVPIIETFQF